MILKNIWKLQLVQNAGPGAITDVFQWRGEWFLSTLLHQAGGPCLGPQQLCHLVEPRKCALPVMVPAPWNTLPSEIKLILSLLASRKCRKPHCSPRHRDYEVSETDSTPYIIDRDEAKDYVHINTEKRYHILFHFQYIFLNECRMSQFTSTKGTYLEPLHIYVLLTTFSVLLSKITNLEALTFNFIFLEWSLRTILGRKE